MKLQDLFVGPIFLIIFYSIAFSLRSRFTNSYTKKYFIPALTLKFIGAISLGLMYQFYYGDGSGNGGDTFNYFKHAEIVFNAFTDSITAGFKLLLSNGNYDPETAKYTPLLYWYKSPTEFFLVKIASIASLFCFKTYSVMSMFFAIYSFSGAWAMYQAFVHIKPTAYKQLAYACFFIPSVFFWGSGLMKDSVCIGALGWLFYSFYNGAIRKKNILTCVLWGSLSIYFIFKIKVYILLSFLPPALIWIFIENSNRIKNKALRTALKPFLISIGIITAFFGLTNLTAGDEEYDLDKIGERTKITQEYLYRRTKDQGSAYNIGSFDGSISSIINVAPQAVIVSLFRPFIWEARSPVMLLSSIESGLFLYMTFILFWRTGFFRSIKLISATPILFFCFIFAIVLAIGVGTNSGNFGTLVRYKIPLMPFYLAALYIMSELVGKKKNVKERRPSAHIK
ncbi:hypothetical protein FY528_06050 [Hymenobacter lutimineralis]|uniref:Glycosyltransferase RgtA/B/C/D-like domain-containing protein n=1 Tax=Hymenobacter lutimineralis TaxID=2606448 RepID=A0A5D6V9R9_9BACT|nr:hypothetical protein [Hymenobacter lutimineralis]TYZ11912.1 hypothetical protein FY528_06050 [Hymenobacter lutimineralis]